MEPSPKFRKRRLRITIVSVVLALVAIPIIVFTLTRRTDRNDGYEQERDRFAKVLSEASDEELFIVLKYAVAHHYVPNMFVDPFHDMYVMVGCWQRSLMIYEKLLDRKDLLQQIYPDLEVLDEYVNWGRQTGAPYPDTIVSQTILDNVRNDINQLDSLMGSNMGNQSLEYKYFGTPLLRR